MPKILPKNEETAFTLKPNLGGVRMENIGETGSILNFTQLKAQRGQILKEIHHTYLLNIPKSTEV